MLKTILAVLVTLLPAGRVCAAESRVAPILKAIDANYKMKNDVRADVTLTQQRVEQGTKIIDMAYFRRDSDDAFLIVMNAPENEKGKRLPARGR
jgi:hypothetical protein